MPAGLPEGQYELHDQQGHRRARVRARVAQVREREPAVRPEPVRARDARRRDRRGRPRDTIAERTADSVSGIAPKAYLGNYKVLTIPTVSGVGLDGNAPEIAKGDRGGGRRRDGRDQPLARRARDRAEPRHRRQGDRRRGRGGRRPGHRRRQRLRRLRPRLGRLAGERAARDHRRRREEVARDRAASPRRARRRLAADEARRHGARRDVLSSVPPREASGPPGAGRAWRRRTSPAPPRCSSRSIRLGRSRRSSRRSS